MRRVFYFAPISTDRINAIYGRDFLSGAATNKVLGVCAALRAGGVMPVTVSGLIPAGRGGLFRAVVMHRTRRVAFAKVWSLGRGLIKRLTGSFGYLLFTLRAVRREDRVLLYNFFPEYVLSALYLRLRGRPAILDIEDAPRADEAGLRGLGNRLSFAVLMRLCATRVVTVSHHLGRELRLPEYLPVYGIAEPLADGGTAAERFAGERVTVLFGGSISHETGLDLYADAIRIIARSDPDLPARFIVTGLYPRETLEALRAEIEGRSRIEIDLRSGLSAAEYRAVAGRADIGLSLKLPEGSMGQTTFPSKVIEYAALGMLLVATPVSDVPAIFADGAAIVLKGSDPAELAARLADAIRDRAGSAATARRGTLAVAAAMSAPAVGRKLVDFLYG